MEQGLAPIDNSKEIQKKEAKQEPKAIERLTVEDQIISLIPLAGTIELTKEQEEALYSPVVLEDVEIRPDGLIYLPWMEYVTRLRKAFGMSWSLIPYGPPKMVGKFIHWGFWLIIKGKPYAFAVGEQQYFEGDRMTHGDALEGAKSNALMRLCKGLGISIELWKPSFVKEWKEKYAESYQEGPKTKWRKKGANGVSGESPKETKPPEEKKETPSQPAGDQPSQNKQESSGEIATTQQIKLLYAKMMAKGIPLEEFEYVFKVKPNLLAKKLVNEGLKWIEDYKPAQ
jgi:hypothetical protein